MPELTNGQMINCADKNRQDLIAIRSTIDGMHDLGETYDKPLNEIRKLIDNLLTETIKLKLDQEIIRLTTERRHYDDIPD